MTRVPAIRFEQFEGKQQGMLLFAATALDLGEWAGVPRKSRRLRMLYQRIFGQNRERDIANYWDAGFQESPVNLSIPTSIVVAMRTPPQYDATSGTLDLEWSPPVDPSSSYEQQLQAYAAEFLSDLLPRFEGDDLALIESMRRNPGDPIPQEVMSSHWLLESALRVAKMASDDNYVNEEAIDEEELAELVLALEQVTRPALVVDGQHRLLGALASRAPEGIHIPVVAIENASWLDQAFQFIVINETAKPVDPAVLTDIIGSSVTPKEAEQLRKAVNSADLKIEERIAATVVDRDIESPFHNIVEIKLWRGDPPPGNRPFKASTIDRLGEQPDREESGLASRW